jgi:hypothetical protein
MLLTVVTLQAGFPIAYCWEALYHRVMLLCACGVQVVLVLEGKHRLAPKNGKEGSQFATCHWGDGSVSPEVANLFTGKLILRVDANVASKHTKCTTPPPPPVPKGKSGLSKGDSCGRKQCQCVITEEKEFNMKQEGTTNTNTMAVGKCSDGHQYVCCTNCNGGTGKLILRSDANVASKHTNCTTPPPGPKKRPGQKRSSGGSDSTTAKRSRGNGVIDEDDQEMHEVGAPL